MDKVNSSITHKENHWQKWINIFKHTGSSIEQKTLILMLNLIMLTLPDDKSRVS